MRAGEVAPVAFHLRHIARSLDRLLTYTEGRQLSEAQLAALKTELAPGAVSEEVFKELGDALEQAATRVCGLPRISWNLPERRAGNGCRQRSAACWYRLRITRSAT
jgi:hypothetical protein